MFLLQGLFFFFFQKNGFCVCLFKRFCVFFARGLFFAMGLVFFFLRGVLCVFASFFFCAGLCVFFFCK